MQSFLGAQCIVWALVQTYLGLYLWGTAIEPLKHISEERINTANSHNDQVIA